MIKNLLTLLFICFLVPVFAIESDTTEPVLYVVEHPAIYSHDCPMESRTERISCGSKNLIKEVYTKVTYPETAKQDGIEGIVVISFVIEKDSTMSNFKILRDPGGGLGEEVLRVMKTLEHKWEPAIHEGKVVRNEFRMPIRFRLPTEPVKKKKKKRRKNKD